MADAKHIIVIDDHFEMLELLRSMLELSGHDYEVLAVPSAEEAMLELVRTRIDLLITDVRLPGMSGFDFVRRARRRYPDLPVIMITAYSSAEGQREAEALGVLRYFSKPLDADEVMTAVHMALYGEPDRAAEPEPPPQVAPALPEEVVRRLKSLRADTGANGLLLATIAGEVLLVLGDRRNLVNPALVDTVARNMKNSFALATQLGESTPFTIQYHAGEIVELYNANIGQRFFISLFYDPLARRGRIGTIWVFAQRAIKELLTLMPGRPGPMWTAPTPPSASGPADPYAPTALLPSLPPRDAPPAHEEAAAADEAAPPPDPETGAPLADPPAAPEPEVQGLLAALDQSAVAAESVPEELERFWEEAAAGGRGAAAEGTISYEEAQALLGNLPAAESAPEDADPTGGETSSSAADATLSAAELDDLLAALGQAEHDPPGAAAAYWDEALDQEPVTGALRGITFDEARRRGLIAPDFDSDPEDPDSA